MSNNYWDFRASYYLGLSFKNPTKNCRYIKMLQAIAANPGKSRLEIGEILGLRKSHIERYYNYDNDKVQKCNHYITNLWEYFQALTEHKFVKVAKVGNHYVYEITAKGENLIKIAK